MLNTAQTVLDKTESLLVKDKFKNKLIRWPIKLIGHPFSFLMLGVQNLFKPMPVMSAIFMGLLIVCIPVIYVLTPPESIRHGYFFAVCFLVFLITIFALPSTFASSGAEKEEVEKVADFVRENKIKTVDDVELLEQNFGFIFERIYNRVKFYQFTIGSLWGLYMYYFNLGIMIGVKEGLHNDGAFIIEHAFLLIGAIFLTLLAITFVLSYKRANERLIKTIQFACVEVKYNLVKENENEIKSCKVGTNEVT